MNILISNSSEEPIYKQITSQIKSMIISGELAEGDTLPSMRHLAEQLKISVITTKRSYNELERDGFIESYTGRGSFVKAQHPELVRKESLRIIEELMCEICKKAKTSGVGIDELKEVLDIIYGSAA